MQAGLLKKLFGDRRQWSGACTLVVDAEASIQTSGADSIVNAGTKIYAPRLISGRVAADAVCFLPDDGVLVVMQVQRIRQSTSEDQLKPTFLIIDPAHLAALEFSDSLPVKALGLSEPPAISPAAAKARN